MGAVARTFVSRASGLLATDLWHGGHLWGVPFLSLGMLPDKASFFSHAGVATHYSAEGAYYPVGGESSRDCA